MHQINLDTVDWILQRGESDRKARYGSQGREKRQQRVRTDDTRGITAVGGAEVRGTRDLQVAEDDRVGNHHIAVRNVRRVGPVATSRSDVASSALDGKWLSTCLWW